MLRRFIIAFIVTVAAILAYSAYQAKYSSEPVKKVSLDTART